MATVLSGWYDEAVQNAKSQLHYIIIGLEKWRVSSLVCDAGVFVTRKMALLDLTGTLHRAVDGVTIRSTPD